MGARLTLGRLLVCATAIAALVFIASACGGGSSVGGTEDPTVARYSDQFLSFTYPSAWSPSAAKGPTEMHFRPLVYLSTQPVHDPCVAQGNATSCDWPIRNLDPGGVLAVWQIPYQLAMPGKVVHTGTKIEVGGDPAWTQNVAGGECRRIGADRTLNVDTAKGLELTVCLRAPGIGQAEEKVNALLASVKFARR
jgi:hypothetical protein